MFQLLQISTDGSAVQFMQTFSIRLSQFSQTALPILLIIWNTECLRFLKAITLLREIGSPKAQFLQCDGMRMRDEAECDDLMIIHPECGMKALPNPFSVFRNRVFLYRAVTIYNELEISDGT